MKTYHKIKTLWKREDTKPHNMVIGEYAEPEFELLKNVRWTATEKIDGTNVRVMWDGNKVSFNGKTDNAQMPMPLVEKLTELFMGEANEQKFEEIFKSEGDEPVQVCLYGEGFGSNIQKGGGNYGDVNFILFDVKIGDTWLKHLDMCDIGVKLGILIAPPVLIGTLQEISDFVAAGFNSEFGEFKAEGIVAKPTTELRTRRGDRIITKLKCKDFDKLDSK